MMRTRTRTIFWLRRPFRGGMTEDCDFIFLPCCERDFLAVLPVCSAALREPGRYAYGFTPGSCTCRRVPPAFRTPTEDSPAVRGDVGWRVRGETTVKRLAMARWCCEGQLYPLHLADCFVCGRSSESADAWRKHPPWLLLVATVAVCSLCTVLPSRSVCLCA
ncbi:chitin binding-like protein [Trypanosoma cruzi cruzi]|nr:chitin binding-like protein [Trypanosoma cruzi cruzi]